MSLAPHHEQLRDAVRRFARASLAPNAPAWDRDKRFPRVEV
jgi:alkylation response protein AidB-like acyl-CoA dehydrogenase